MLGVGWGAGEGVIQMQYVDVVLVSLSLIAAFCLGFLVPWRFGSKIPGFSGGMLGGILITLLAGVMTAYLIAGWGQDLLGMFLGVPLGLFVGCFLGTVAFNFLLGGIGAAVVAIMAKKRRREP